MIRMRQRAALAAAVVALLAGLTAACDGDEPSDKAKPPETGVTTPGAKPTPKPTSESPGPGDPEAPIAPKKDLSKAELEKAILSKGDVPGFDIGPMDGPPPKGETPDKPECAPLTAVINGAPEPDARGAAYRQLVGTGEGGPAVSEFLTSHGAQGAPEVLRGLRNAVKDCARGFTATDGEGEASTYRSVRELPVAKAGDDAFGYQVTGDFQGLGVPLVFQVVRSGPTLATFYTANFEGSATPKIPQALLTAQLAQLAKLS